MRAVVQLHEVMPGEAVPLPPLALVADDRGVAERLAERLDARGVDVLVVAGPEELDDPSRGVVFLGALRSDAAWNARAIHREALRAAQRASLDAAWVTVTALGGDFGLSGLPSQDEALLAGLAGFTKTVALEHPAAFVRALDLAGDDVDALAARIDAELGMTGPVEVGVPSASRRMTLVTEDAPLAPWQSPESNRLGRDDVIVVSGGARGVTAACLVALARAWQPSLVLLGRSRIDQAEPPGCEVAVDEPGLKRALFAADRTLAPAEVGRRAAAILAAREARANVAAMQAAGSRVRYVAVDVQDAAAVTRALDAVRAEWGPITGLVHGAGVLHDKRVKDKTAAQFDAVLDTKLTGLAALLSATSADPLRVLVLFSSVAARGGNVGQSDYALANEALNRIAASEALRRPGCVVRSIGWGPWEGGMVTPALARQFHAMGVPLLPIDAGADTFVREIAAGPGPVESIVGGEIAPPNRRATVLRPSATSCPQLVDHALTGVPVLPAVMAADALLRAARGLRPGASVALRDLRVLKGVQLHRWIDGEDALEAIAEADADGVALLLRGARGVPHYRARGVVDAESPPPMPTVHGQPWPTSIEEVYASNDLFHGPAFRALRSVAQSDVGLDATLATGTALGWPAPVGPLDVPLMDGAVQLAALWTRRQLGGASLPTHIGEVRSWRAPRGRSVRAVLTPVRATRTSTVSNVVLADDAGVFAFLGQVEMHVLPSGAYPRGGAEA